MAGGGPKLGRWPSSSDASRGPSSARAPSRRPSELTTAAGIVIRAPAAACGAGRRRGSRRGDGRTSPSARDLARVGTVLESGRPRAVEWFGQRPARDVPGSEARRARSAGGSRPSTEQIRAVRAAAGERRPRRRPLARARATRRGSGCGSTSIVRARSRRPTSALRTSHAAGHDVELLPRPETIVHIDAAHRGLGTASCGPDTLRRTSSGRGTYSWTWSLSRAGAAERADRVGRERSPVPPHNGRLSYILAVHENGALGLTALRRSARRRALVPPPRPGAVRGVREPPRRSGRPRMPDAGQRRLPRAGSGRRAARRLDRPRARLRRAPDRARQAAARRPAFDVRRGRRRGGDAGGRARRRADRPRVTLSYTIFRDVPVVARSAGSRNGGAATLVVRSR